jgi:hypothetical protein
MYKRSIIGSACRSFTTHTTRHNLTAQRVMAMDTNLEEKLLGTKKVRSFFNQHIKRSNNKNLQRRYFLERIVSRMFNGNVAAAARAFDRTPAQLHQWLNGYRNISDTMSWHIKKIVHSCLTPRKHSFRGELIARLVESVKGEINRESLFLDVMKVVDKHMETKQKIAVYNQLRVDMFGPSASTGADYSKLSKTVFEKIAKDDVNANS